MDRPRSQNANDLHEARLTRTERLCQRIAEWTGAPGALLAAIVLQAIWISVGIWTHIDPFPFVFLLTVSNVIQLVLIFVIAVAQRQQSRHDQLRAEMDHAALCRLLDHQDVQEQILISLARQQGIDITGVARAVERLTAGQHPESATPLRTRT